MTFRDLLPIIGSAVLSISCATSSPISKDLSSAETVLGFDDDVRVEAAIYPDPTRPNGNMRVVCRVENRSKNPILVYDIDSISVYDPDSRTFTINVGAEIPTTGAEPIEILSAEQRIFERTVSLQSIPPFLQRVSNLIRVRLHFLKEAIFSLEPVEEEPSVITWAEYKRTVDTNTIPVY